MSPRRGQPRPRARALARRELARRPRQGVHRRERRRLRPLGGAAARRVDREAREGARAGAGRAAGRAGPPGAGGAPPGRVRARAGVLPLGVRDRGRRLDPRHQPVRPARRAVGEGQDEGSARVGLGAGRVACKDRRRSCSRRRSRATTSASRRSSTRPPRTRRRCSRSRARAREATGCVVTHGFGPRYLHSTGQLHKGGPPTGLFLQVVDDTGDEIAIPNQPFGFGKLIRAQAAGDFASLQERGRRVARVRLEEV